LYRVFILTDPENADGFRLGGVDVRIAANEQEAHRTLASMVEEESVGVLGVNEQWLTSIDDRLRRRIDSLYRPIVVGIPVRDTLAVPENRGAYLSRLIRRAVGFDITLRRG
jgi:V/A-type H+-transporting ATPase subunit F